jgi:hypothetical protein
LVAIAAVALLPGGRAEAARQRALTVEVVGEGRVSSTDRRIVCAGRCSLAYRQGKIVELRTSAAGDFKFERWEGACVGVATSCLIALDRPAAVRAVFARRPASIQLLVGGPGDVSSEPPGVSCGVSSQDCQGEFGLGATIQLFGTAAPGAVLDSWGDGCQRTGPTSCLLVVRGGNEVSPTFRQVSSASAPQELRIDNPGSARVTSDPSGIDCPPVCSASFEPRALVRLGGVGVTRWGGGCTGQGSRCNLIVGSPTVVTIESPPVGPPQPPPPPPAPSRRYGSWGGFCSGKAATCTVRVTAAKTVMAIFRPRRERL